MSLLDGLKDSLKNPLAENNEDMNFALESDFEVALENAVDARLSPEDIEAILRGDDDIDDDEDDIDDPDDDIDDPDYDIDDDTVKNLENCKNACEATMTALGIDTAGDELEADDDTSDPEIDPEGEDEILSEEDLVQMCEALCANCNDTEDVADTGDASIPKNSGDCPEDVNAPNHDTGDASIPENTEDPTPEGDEDEIDDDVEALCGECESLLNGEITEESISDIIKKPIEAFKNKKAKKAKGAEILKSWHNMKTEDIAKTVVTAIRPYCAEGPESKAVLQKGLDTWKDFQTSNLKNGDELPTHLNYTITMIDNVYVAYVPEFLETGTGLNNLIIPIIDKHGRADCTRFKASGAADIVADENYARRLFKYTPNNTTMESFSISSEADINIPENTEDPTPEGDEDEIDDDVEALCSECESLIAAVEGIDCDLAPEIDDDPTANECGSETGNASILANSEDPTPEGDEEDPAGATNDTECDECTESSDPEFSEDQNTSVKAIAESDDDDEYNSDEDEDADSSLESILDNLLANPI